jgi:hypothetical protein
MYFKPDDTKDIDETCVKPNCLTYNCVVDVSFCIKSNE